MEESKDLSKCSSQEIKTFMDSFDDVLLDCDGVLFNIIKLIPGVGESINCLRKLGKSIKVITNNCTRTMESWEEHFQNHNLNCRGENVIFPTNVLLDYFRDINFSKNVLVLGSAAIEKILSDAGYDVFDYNEKNHYEVAEAIVEMTEKTNIGAIVIDWDVNLTYMKWMKAAAALRNPDVLFICLAYDKYVPLPDNVFSLGPYFICHPLECWTGRTAMKISKPHPMYTNYIKNKYSLNPSRTLFVGDTLENDMAFAADNGFQKLMVLTGVAKLEDLKTCDDHVKPKYYLESLGELHKIVE